MPQASQIFRDFGIIPDRVGPPPAVVRARFAVGDIVWQYCITGMGLSIAGILIFSCLIAPPFPSNIVLALVALVLSALVICSSVRQKYVWVELDGNTIRARHLITRRTHERLLTEIDHLETLVMRVQSPLTTIALQAVYGRIRGYLIRFRDRRSPIAISRVDPAMMNAQELIEAIVYRMSQHGDVDAEVVEDGGPPIVSKIRWRSDGRGAIPNSSEKVISADENCS